VGDLDKCGLVKARRSCRQEVGGADSGPQILISWYVIGETLLEVWQTSGLFVGGELIMGINRLWCGVEEADWNVCAWKSKVMLKCRDRPSNFGFRV
jgi:hypothetical protein